MAKVIKDFELVGDNLKLVWMALKTRFENKRLLVSNQMKKLFGMQAAQVETLKSIRTILSIVNDCISILKTYDINVENDNPLLMHPLILKLPEEMLRAWEVTIENHKQLPSWNQFSEFLTARIEILEAMSDLRKPTSKEPCI